MIDWRASAGQSLGETRIPMAASGGASGASGTTPRFPQLKLEDLDAAQRPLGEYILKVSSVGISGPYNPLLRSPVMAKRMLDLLDYLRWNSSLSNKVTELAILIQARRLTSQVEWFAHQPIAIKAGLSETLIAELKEGKRPASMQTDEAVIYDFCMELSERHGVSDATYARAKAIFTDQQIVDLTTVCGTYITIAMLLAVAEECVPRGEPPLKPLKAPLPVG